MPGAGKHSRPLASNNLPPRRNRSSDASAYYSVSTDLLQVSGLLSLTNFQTSIPINARSRRLEFALLLRYSSGFPAIGWDRNIQESPRTSIMEDVVKSDQLQSIRERFPRRQIYLTPPSEHRTLNSSRTLNWSPKMLLKVFDNLDAPVTMIVPEIFLLFWLLIMKYAYY